MTQTTGPRPATPSSGRRTTLTEVAKRAQVSLSTASKVVNGRSDVSSRTRSRVEDVIDELGYVSLGERQGTLKTTGEMTVEVLVDPHSAENPYLATILSGALAAATKQGVALVVRSGAHVASLDPVRWAQTLARAGRTGVIEVTNSYSLGRERALQGVGLPMVLVDPIDVPRTEVPSIGATNWAGAYSATQHLIGLGHTKIRYIGGPPGARCDHVRAHGWAAAMSDAGLEADMSAIPRLNFEFEHGLTSATAMLTSADPPTAIFAGADTSAMGVLEAARRLGLNVPRDLSVVGFDDTMLAQVSAPQLTTVHQPIGKIGATAVTTLVNLARGEILATKRVELATHLVVRDSTAAPRNANKKG